MSPRATAARTRCAYRVFFASQGSQEETKDVLEAYKICKGKMLGIIDSIMLATEGARRADVTPLTPA